MLRIILSQCFGLRSAAIYHEDLDGNQALHKLTGRIAPTDDGVIEFGDVPLRVLKTHSPPQDGSKAIYVIRNGVDATASFHDHGKRQVPVETLIRGRKGLPTWSAHVESWQPKTRPSTLLLHYEDVVLDFDSALQAIATFIEMDPKRRSIPSRDELAALDGRWIRSANAPNRTELTDWQKTLFWEVNGAVMTKYGYTGHFGQNATTLRDLGPEMAARLEKP